MATSAMMDEMSLSELFWAAHTIFEENQEGEATPQSKIRALLMLAKCQGKVEQLSMFSLNETLDDIPTADLPYVLLPYYQGILQSSAPGSDQVQKLKKSKAFLDQYIETCERLELFDPEDLKAWQEQKKDPGSFRTQKVLRFKRDKAAKEKMKELQTAQGKETKDIEDEETLRELVLLMIQSGIRGTLDELSMVDREMEMALMMEKMKLERPQPPPQQEQLHETQFDQNMRKKQEMIDGVFRNPNPPTMSIEEFAAMEARDAKERAARQSEAEASKARQQQDVDDDKEEAVDAATYKARQWDDWKDDHKRGSGNRMNRG